MGYSLLSVAGCVCCGYHFSSYLGTDQNERGASTNSQFRSSSCLIWWLSVSFSVEEQVRVRLWLLVGRWFLGTVSKMLWQYKHENPAKQKQLSYLASRNMMTTICQSEGQLSGGNFKVEFSNKGGQCLKGVIFLQVNKLQCIPCLCWRFKVFLHNCYIEVWSTELKRFLMPTVWWLELCSWGTKVWECRCVYAKDYTNL